jgi:hypothetical protein
MRHGLTMSVVVFSWVFAGCSGHPGIQSSSTPDGGFGVGGRSASSGVAGGSAATARAGSGGGVVGGSAGSMATTSKVASLCGGSCQCSDGIDNDGDGQIDGFDTECVSPNDNDEGSFATGIPGDNVDPKWQDCFFDGNSGGGDDGCRYSTDCLTGKKSATDPACQLAQACIDFCKPLTPNGCDCFGCCTVRKPDGSTIDIVLNANCDASNLDKCTKCVPTTQCGNTCGECELCPGKTAADLPSSCNPPPPPTGSGGMGGSGGTGTAGAGGGPSYTCDNGETVCTTKSDCGAYYYCSFGCCLVAPPI